MGNNIILDAAFIYALAAVLSCGMALLIKGLVLGVRVAVRKSS